MPPSSGGQVVGGMVVVVVVVVEVVVVMHVRQSMPSLSRVFSKLVLSISQSMFSMLKPRAPGSGHGTETVTDA